MTDTQKRFDTAIQSGVKEGLSKAVPSMVEAAMEAIFEHQAYRVVVGGQLRLMEAGIAPMKAWEMSRACLAEFLKSEKVEFGDTRFTWDVEAGRTLVEEFEIEHWEAS